MIDEVFKIGVISGFYTRIRAALRFKKPKQPKIKIGTADKLSPDEEALADKGERQAIWLAVVVFGSLLAALIEKLWKYFIK